jgi:hypothetical protein
MASDVPRLIANSLGPENRLEHILDWILPSRDDQTDRYAEVRDQRAPGTCVELLGSDILKQWKDGEGTSRFLCCYGDPGAGKSVSWYGTVPKH